MHTIFNYSHNQVTKTNNKFVKVDPKETIFVTFTIVSKNYSVLSRQKIK